MPLMMPDATIGNPSLETHNEQRCREYLNGQKDRPCISSKSIQTIDQETEPTGSIVGLEKPKEEKVKMLPIKLKKQAIVISKAIQVGD